MMGTVWFYLFASALAMLASLTAVTLVSPAYALEYLDVDLDLVGYQNTLWCMDCRSFPDKGGEHILDDEDFSGRHTLHVFDVRIDDLRGIRNLDMDGTDFILVFYNGGKQYTIESMGGDRTTSDNDSRRLNADEWRLECALPDGVDIGPDDAVVWRVCFTIPASITRIQSFVMSHPDAGVLQIVPFHPLTCESFENTDYCSANWDLANPKKFDGVYEYVVINPTAYDRFRPEYGRVMQDAIASGLQAWADNNPDISFVQVDHANNADFSVFMGGTGESYTYKTDVFGSVSEAGCLLDLDDGCAMTLFVENRGSDGSVQLFDPKMIEFVTAHETGHLFGFPHHASALHVMHSPLDDTRTWYDDSEYGLVSPYLTQPSASEPENSYMESDGSNGSPAASPGVADQGREAVITQEFYLVDPVNLERVPTSVVVRWDSSYGAGDSIPFDIAFFDDSGNPIDDTRYGYWLFQDDEIITEFHGDGEEGPGILSVEGIDTQRITIPESGQYRLDIMVYGTGLAYNQTHAGIGTTILEIGPKAATEPLIPDWIRNNAGWWAEGLIDDQTFLGAIQFLISEGIISVPDVASTGEGSRSVPDWIRNNAGWWAEGLIDDQTFLGAIQFLISEGMLSVG